ncbi:MAG: GTPase domain-containing protein [Candidatus Thorarchaeota archaeon]|nr:GTPase domain-containing protein [Candidatus Thorarchaeota archaeon]
MLIDHETRTIGLKIVFFGPAMSGKTTAVKWLFEALGLAERLSSVENTLGRTMFFDFGTIPIPLGKDWTVNAQIWSATGQDYYSSTRSTVLMGTDGLVFVADSNPTLMQENLQSWRELMQMLPDDGTRIPVVVCLNKQDLPDAVSEETLRTSLNIEESVPVYRVVAKNGTNVAEAVHRVLQDTIRDAISRV